MDQKKTMSAIESALEEDLERETIVLIVWLQRFSFGFTESALEREPKSLISRNYHFQRKQKELTNIIKEDDTNSEAAPPMISMILPIMKIQFMTESIKELLLYLQSGEMSPTLKNGQLPSLKDAIQYLNFENISIHFNPNTSLSHHLQLENEIQWYHQPGDPDWCLPNLHCPETEPLPDIYRKLLHTVRVPLNNSEMKSKFEQWKNDWLIEQIVSYDLRSAFARNVTEALRASNEIETKYLIPLWYETCSDKKSWSKTDIRNAWKWKGDEPLPFPYIGFETKPILYLATEYIDEKDMMEEREETAKQTQKVEFMTRQRQLKREEINSILGKKRKYKKTSKLKKEKEKDEKDEKIPWTISQEKDSDGEGEERKEKERVLSSRVTTEQEFALHFHLQTFDIFGGNVKTGQPAFDWKKENMCVAGGSVLHAVIPELESGVLRTYLNQSPGAGDILSRVLHHLRTGSSLPNESFNSNNTTGNNRLNQLRNRRLQHKNRVKREFKKEEQDEKPITVNIKMRQEKSEPILVNLLFKKTDESKQNITFDEKSDDDAKKESDDSKFDEKSETKTKAKQTIDKDDQESTISSLQSNEKSVNSAEESDSNSDKTEIESNKDNVKSDAESPKSDTSINIESKYESKYDTKRLSEEFQQAMEKEVELENQDRKHSDRSNEKKDIPLTTEAIKKHTIQYLEYTFQAEYVQKEGKMYWNKNTSSHDKLEYSHTKRLAPDQIYEILQSNQKKLKSSPYHKSDIDVFLLASHPYDMNLSCIHAVQSIDRLYRHLKSRIRPTQHIMIQRTQWTLTFKMPYPMPNVQIILRIYPSIYSVVEGFDLACCAIGFDTIRPLCELSLPLTSTFNASLTLPPAAFTKTNVVCTGRFNYALTHNINIMVSSRASLTFEQRAVKYYMRNFRIGLVGLVPKYHLTSGICTLPFDQLPPVQKLLRYWVEPKSAPTIWHQQSNQDYDGSDFEQVRTMVQFWHKLGRKDGKNIPLMLTKDDLWQAISTNRMFYPVREEYYQRRKRKFMSKWIKKESIVCIPPQIRFLVSNPGRQDRLVDQSIHTSSFHPTMDQNWYGIHPYIIPYKEPKHNKTTSLDESETKNIDKLSPFCVPAFDSSLLQSLKERHIQDWNLDYWSRELKAYERKLLAERKTDKKDDVKKKKRRTSEDHHSGEEEEDESDDSLGLPHANRRTPDHDLEEFIEDAEYRIDELDEQLSDARRMHEHVRIEELDTERRRVSQRLQQYHNLLDHRTREC
jgi:hypothetical protein